MRASQEVHPRKSCSLAIHSKNVVLKMRYITNLLFFSEIKNKVVMILLSEWRVV